MSPSLRMNPVWLSFFLLTSYVKVQTIDKLITDPLVWESMRYVGFLAKVCAESEYTYICEFGTSICKWTDVTTK